MQKLKVYLTKQTRDNKNTIDRIKEKMLKNKSNGWNTNMYINNIRHNISQNNLSKSSNIKDEINVSKKKRVTTNSYNHSHSQLQEFKTEFKSLIKQPIRYQSNKDVSKKDNTLIREIKKNSKLAISDCKLNYKSQPHINIQRVGRKNNKSQKYLDVFGYKRVKENLQNNGERKVQSKSSYKQEVVPNTSKNNQMQKIPAKKRSKSANMEYKTENDAPKNQKQKRSRSVKKESLPLQPESVDQFKMKNSMHQIQLKSMFRTRKGVQINNPNKVNQDRFFIKQNTQISANKNICLYAVADGHGPYGHLVSNLIAENLYKRIQFYLKQSKSIRSSLQKTYKDLQTVLQKNNDFNSDISGSTLVTILVENNHKISCANVGDSRAIVARQLNKHNWEIIRLSNDHKPSLEEEKKRIIGLGGRVETVYDETGKSLGPMRVWLPKKQIQGLAMSRSLGDNISKPIGVTYEPEILTHQLTKDDKFILLASDGVWQFLSNYQILSLIIPYYRQNRLEDACQALMMEAYKSWTTEDNTVIDDITFILIFLSAQYNSAQNQAKMSSRGMKQKYDTVKQFKASNQNSMDQKQLENLPKRVQNKDKTKENDLSPNLLQKNSRKQ